MGSYFIFALVLTVLYIVYFAVNIIRDLYGKKGTEKTDEEVFDLGPMDSTEESVEVSENETGFKIGNETYGTETVPAASPAAQNLSLIHISEPTRLGMISYAVFCLKKKKKTKITLIHISEHKTAYM